MSIPKLDAHQLRLLADLAASERKPGGDPYYGVVVQDPDNPLGVMLKLEVGTGGAVPRDAVFEIDTRDVAVRPAVTAMIVDCEGATRDLSESYDAVFWSEAAVEKFVFPYYASKSLWEAAAVLEKLSKNWYGTIPPDTGGDGGPASDETLVGMPFALAHTPDSDWNTLSDDLAAPAGSLGSDLHLLVRDGNVVRARRLSDLKDLSASAGRADRARRTPAATAAA